MSDQLWQGRIAALKSHLCIIRDHSAGDERGFMRVLHAQAEAGIAEADRYLADAAPDADKAGAFIRDLWGNSAEGAFEAACLGLPSHRGAE